MTIPSPDRKEWSEIMEGKCQFNKFTHQLMVNRLRRQLEDNLISQPQAVKEIIAMIRKYPKAFAEDIENIFGSQSYD